MVEFTISLAELAINHANLYRYRPGLSDIGPGARRLGIFTPDSTRQEDSWSR
jgi:hypothetical protein